jgi:amino acid adenylation domain-containing protein
MSWGRNALKKDQLDDEKELLLRLLEKEGVGPAIAQPAKDAAVAQFPAFQKSSQEEPQENPPARPTIFPLSYPQERLWFLQRFKPESDFYNVLAAWRIQGDLNLLTLKMCLVEVVRRHEILRTCFVLGEDEQPKQKVLREMIDVRLPLIDLSDTDVNEREEQAKHIVLEEAAKPFNLEQLPLFRSVLVRLGDHEHILGLSMHHIICDLWSVKVLMDEWGALYETHSKSNEENSPLPEPRLQYGDYALQQWQWMQGGKFEQQMRYWKEQLNGMPHVLHLPTDFTRPRRQSFRGETESCTFSGALLEELNAIGKPERASLFMALLAAFEILLMRYSGQEDFGVGIPVANRKKRDTEGLIGFCLNTLVMRADLLGEMSFREVMRKTREAVLEGFEHQDLPFEKLVQELAPDRDVSRTPIFQIMFTVQDGASKRFNFGELQVSEVKVDLPTSKFDLLMIVAEEQGENQRGAIVQLNYATDLFESETMRRMLGHYENLLRTVVENPDWRICDLPLLSPQEIEQLHRWNQTEKNYLRDKSVAALFEEQAEHIPAALAVEYQNQKLTYEDLNRRANRLAHYLRSLGVAPNTRVCICVERSIEMVVALLAVVKTGGACVPLDPAYPQERLQFMLQNSAPVAVLTQSHLLPIFHEIQRNKVRREELRVIDLESPIIWNAQPESNPEYTSADPESVVYVIYTSGSTGQPKGVAMPMRAMMNLLTFQMTQSTSGAPQRTLQFAALGFDVSFQEIFSTLCAGGSLVLIEEDKRLSPADLTHYVIEKRIERLFIPVVGLQMLAEGVAQMGANAGEKERIDCALQHVIVAGEQLRIDDRIRALFERLAPCRLDNQYGPTETHLACAFRLPIQSKLWPALPPIGRPIANTQIYILDKYRQTVPVGVVGEIFIGGAGVAQGYWNRPELTEQCFLENHLAKEKGARMYRTGDLGRWSADGTIEYVGRNDFQVKIRGYRIELGEIEAVLQLEKGVRGCAVVVRAGANGNKQLVAYVAGESTTQELRQALKEKLPGYMIPSAIVVLRELPLTGNGKVDRLALPGLDALELSEATDQNDAPRTSTEAQLAGIWREVLLVSRIGMHSNFFDLGGHSLLATLMATRMRNALGIDVPVRAIFESPTIAELAEVIDLDLRQTELRESGLPNKVVIAKSAQANRTEKPCAEPANVRSSLFPLSYPQEQLWFLDRLQPGSDFYNVSLAWRVKGDLDLLQLERSLEQIVQRHEILRTRYVMTEDGQPRQEVMDEGIEIRLRFTDLLDNDDDESQKEQAARKILTDDGSRGFDLSQAPLIRGVLVRIGEKDHALGLTLHHVVCDDWSLKLLMNEWSTLYEAYVKGEESPLPELQLQYGDYALEQRQKMQGNLIGRQMEYWKKQLEGMPQVLDLPTDKPRPVHQSFRGGTEHRCLSADLRDRLNALAKRERASLFMTLLAAFQVLLMRYSGQRDFGVGTVVANRDRRETENLIGFFLNTLVMRARFHGEPIFREVLQRVRQSALGAFEHQDLPFERLVEELASGRDIGRNPVFQAVFTLRKAPDKNFKFAGLRLEDFETDLNTSKFDLIMGIEEREHEVDIVINYVADLFEAQTIQRMLEHYEHLLESIVADIDQSVWALSMMGKPERQMLSCWQQMTPASGRRKNIVEIFESAAESQPEATAAIFGQMQMSWSELNIAANQVAHSLLNIGVISEFRAGIFMPDSAEKLTAILGVLKAGGAYALLDIQNPRDRLRTMTTNAGFTVLLTLQAWRKYLPETNVPVRCVDSGSEAIAKQSKINPRIPIRSEDLACLIFISASEKNPKVSMIEHAGVAALFLGRDSAAVSVQSGGVKERVASKIWPRLMSSSFLVTSQAFLMPLPEVQGTPARTIAIADIYILDSYLQQVAIDVPGEIWVRGVAAGRGYLQQPSLTAEKFLPDPFSSEMGTRMFATGNRARYRQDGTIELLGRLDDRVELKGHLVELEEIETALTNYEGLQQVVAVVSQSGKLVVYVVANDGKKLAQSDLRDYLDKKLPPFMVPNVFIALRQLPRNAHGDVDRAALSVLGQEKLDREFISPRTELEQTIASAWQSTLHVEKVGVHDSFFDLGGHSVLAIRLVEKLRETLGLEIELLHLFQFPTIDSLVRFLHTGYNFDGKSRDTRERAGRQKSALEKFRRIHTPCIVTH